MRPPWQLVCCRLLQLKGRSQVTEHTAYLSNSPCLRKNTSWQGYHLTHASSEISSPHVFCVPFLFLSVYRYSEHSLNILYTFERLLLRTEFQMFGITNKKIYNNNNKKKNKKNMNYRNSLESICTTIHLWLSEQLHFQPHLNRTSGQTASRLTKPVFGLAEQAIEPKAVTFSGNCYLCDLCILFWWGRRMKKIWYKSHNIWWGPKVFKNLSD